MMGLLGSPLAIIVTLAPFLLPAFVAAVAVNTERTDKLLNRVRYCQWLGLLVLLPYAIYFAGITLLITVYFSRDPATGGRLVSLTDYFWELYVAGIAVNCLFTFLATRLLVRRLRDADITEKLAYLVAVPYLKILVILALAIYPPSRRLKPIPVEVF